jgi:hypothetical protein
MAYIKDLKSVIFFNNIKYLSKLILFHVKVLIESLISCYLIKKYHKYNYLHVKLKIIILDDYIQKLKEIETESDKYSLKIE